MRAVLNGIPGMVGYWDTQLRNRLANDAYVEYFGVTPDEIRGRHIRDVLGPAVFEMNLPHMKEALAGREVTFDRDLTDVAGRPRYVQASYIPDIVEGVVEGFFVLVTDITARVVAERGMHKALDNWRALARSLPSGFVLVFDTDLRFQVADGIELGSFGIHREAAEGRTLGEVFDADQAADLEPRYRAALRGETVSWEQNLGTKTFRLTAGPVRSDEGVQAAMVVAQDVTEARLTERTWSALHLIATDVAQKGTPEEVAMSVASALVSIFNVDSAAVVRYASDSSADVLAMAPEHPRNIPDTATFARGDQSTTAQILETGEPFFARYAPSGGDLAQRALDRGLRSGAGAPIRHDGELWGAIVIGCAREDAMTEEILPPLARFAELLEIAVGTTESWASLSREAQVDELTGLPNRRTFNKRLEVEVERSHRHQRPLSVAMMDLDHFKDVNDRFGHDVGDVVLCELGKRMAAVCRDGETLARIGGEEFAWIMPETEAVEAVAAADRLRRDVSAHPFPIVGRLTISVGVAELDPGSDAAGLVKRSDEALYAAKAQGRDRVIQR